MRIFTFRAEACETNAIQDSIYRLLTWKQMCTCCVHLLLRETSNNNTTMIQLLVEPCNPRTAYNTLLEVVESACACCRLFVRPNFNLFVEMFACVLACLLADRNLQVIHIYICVNIHISLMYAHP